MDFTDFVQIDENQVTKKRMFWENGYCLGYTCRGEKSHPWLKLSYDVLKGGLNQKFRETI